MDDWKERLSKRMNSEDISCELSENHALQCKVLFGQLSHKKPNSGPVLLKEIGI